MFVVTSRLPSFVELVEKFLIIFQGALSGLNDAEKEEMAVYLIPEVCISSFILLIEFSTNLSIIEV